MQLLPSDLFPNTYYEKIGQGFPLVFIHGFAEDHSIWTNQIVELAKTYQLIIPDLPGSGTSEMPKERLSIELMADYIQAILTQEGIPEAIILGHSMGGYVALAFTDRYPHRVKALGLIHSTAYADDEEKKTNRRKAIALIENQEQGKEAFLQAMVPNLYDEDFKKGHNELIQHHLTLARKIPSSHLVAYYQAMIERPERIHVLKNSKTPVLFVIGDKDNAISLSSSLAQCHIPAISQVEILRNVGHTSMYEAPEKLNAILNSFANYVLDL